MWPASEKRLPGACVLQLGSERKHGSLQHMRQGEGASTAAPRWGAGRREAPVGGRQLFVSVQPGPVHASLWHTSFRRVWLLPFQLSTLQSQLGKPKGKTNK